MHLQYANEKNISTIAWAFSKLNILDDYIWQNIEKKSLKHLESKNCDYIGTIIYTFQTIDKGSEIFWNSMEIYTLKNSLNMQPRSLVNILWSFAKR